MTYWVEVRAWQERRGRPFFVELGDLSRFRGFRSVYAYPEDVKDAIAAAGVTSALGAHDVYSDTLFVDFDNGAPDDMTTWLYDNGHTFTVYWSGGRSYHVHAPIEPMLGRDVPWSQRLWVQGVAPTADLTFYHASGQFRLPGTIHAKTGGLKTLVSHHQGSVLEIPLVNRPVERHDTKPAGSDVGRFFSHLAREKAEGARRVYAWHLAMLAATEGVPFAVALKNILWWNKVYCKPSLTPESVEAKCHEAYRDHSRRLP